MNILICDDDITVIEEINALIESRKEFNEIEFEIDNRTSTDFILTESKSYDVAFIDISMPEISGLELAEKLKEINPDIIIIITTSYSNYLDDAMKIKVFRYISKPFNAHRLLNAFYDALREYYSISKTIVIDKKNKVYTIKTKDILYLETVKNGTLIVTRNGDFKTNKKIEECLSLIDQPECFVSSHKSFTVNLQNVIAFSNTEIELRKNDDEIIRTYISQRRFKAFKKLFMNFCGGRVNL